MLFYEVGPTTIMGTGSNYFCRIFLEFVYWLMYWNHKSSFSACLLLEGKTVSGKLNHPHTCNSYVYHSKNGLIFIMAKISSSAMRISTFPPNVSSELHLNNSWGEFKCGVHSTTHVSLYYSFSECLWQMWVCCFSFWFMSPEPKWD